MPKRIVVVGGGTMSYIRPHLALCAPAFGQTVIDIDHWTSIYFEIGGDWALDTYYTKMAHEQCSSDRHIDPGNKLETNADVSALLDRVISDPSVRVVFLPVAMCDYDAVNIIRRNHAGKVREGVGKHLPRLKTSDYTDYGSSQLSVELEPAEKVIQKVRKDRKDIFLVGFKTTTGLSEMEQFEAGLNLLKTASCNLVLANDLVNHRNMVITPEQAKYAVTTDRDEAIRNLVKIAASRCKGTFTRSSVKPGDIVPWNSPEIPANLRTVVNYCIKRGAYRPFNGKTVGHFAAKVGDGKFLTSIRKTNFNDLLKDPSKNGLVRVEAEGDDRVVAYGARPSVGGQSQRSIFLQHPETDCIVHAHVQLKPGSAVPVVPQWPNECGSHGCGQATASGLVQFDDIKVVFLDRHGPNVVFSKNTDPQKVIDFIETNFDLDHQTSEL